MRSCFEKGKLAAGFTGAYRIYDRRIYRFVFSGNVSELRAVLRAEFPHRAWSRLLCPHLRTDDPYHDRKRDRRCACTGGLSVYPLMSAVLWGWLRSSVEEGRRRHRCPEEKKTDVNISIRMVADCVLNNTDRIVLISADSDLIPPLEFIQEHYKHIGIKVYFPPSNYSNDLKDNMWHHRSKPVLLKNNLRRFEEAAMPQIVRKDGKEYSIPPKWLSFMD